MWAAASASRDPQLGFPRSTRGRLIAFALDATPKFGSPIRLYHATFPPRLDNGRILEAKVG